MAGKNGLHSQHDRAVSRLRPLFQQSRSKTLCRGQCVIIADQEHISGHDHGGQLLGTENGLVRTKGVVEVAQILSASARIVGAQLALDASQRVHLCGIAA